PWIHTQANRALTLARMGDYRRAAAAARVVDGLNPPAGDTRYQLAAALAASAGLAGRYDKSDPAERARLADEYAAAALAQLKQSAERGHYKKPTRVEDLGKARAFAAVLGGREFRSWLDGLRPKPGKP